MPFLCNISLIHNTIDFPIQNYSGLPLYTDSPDKLLSGRLCEIKFSLKYNRIEGTLGKVRRWGCYLSRINLMQSWFIIRNESHMDILTIIILIWNIVLNSSILHRLGSSTWPSFFVAHPHLHCFVSCIHLSWLVMSLHSSPNNVDIPQMTSLLLKTLPLVSPIFALLLLEC